jgi:predicted CoA-substrate-specific enzyme activase
LAVRPTGWDIEEAGRLIVGELTAAAGRPAPAPEVVATGYGRAKVRADRTITEITCHARGAERLRPGARAVIDIGGQDYKVIAAEGGRVTSFQMNDKCAAGSGRFLEVVLGRLGLDLAGLDAFLAPGRAIALNSTCVVFAESEIIGLLAKGVPRQEILGGVVASMATKIASQAARLDLAEPAILTGGLAESRGVAEALSKALGRTVEPTPDGWYAGAIGAACLGGGDREDS